MSAVTIQGESFTLPDPFAEGHVLSAPEAAKLNQTLHEQIRVNFNAKVKAAKAGATFDHGAFQTQIDSATASFQFGTRARRGSKNDPIAREALRLAIDSIGAHLRKAGKKPSDYSNIKEMAAELVASDPAFTAKATEIVADRQSAGAESIDTVLSALTTKPPKAAAQAVAA